MGCFTLPGGSGFQQLEGNVYWDERDSGIQYLTRLYTLIVRIFSGKNPVILIGTHRIRKFVWISSCRFGSGFELVSFSIVCY